MKNLLKLAALGLVTAPFLAQAEDAIALSTRLLTGIGTLVRIATPIVFALAILAFFWGIFRYVYAQSGEAKVDAKKVMLWSLIAVFVMASLFGIITLFQTTFGIQTGGGGSFQVPKIGN